MILKSIVANTPTRFSTLPRPRLQLCGFLATNKFLYDYDIKKTWTVQNVLALNGDKWVGAPQEMSNKFGTTWTFSDEFITIDRQIVKYKLEDDIIILENGDSFKIISLTENDMQLGSPVTKATVYIIFKSESRARQ